MSLRFRIDSGLKHPQTRIHVIVTTDKTLGLRPDLTISGTQIRPELDRIWGELVFGSQNNMPDKTIK